MPSLSRVLAIGRPTVDRASPDYQAVLPREAQASLRLYLDGKLDQHWLCPDLPGVAHLVNAETVEEARAIIEQLPLVSEGKMEFEYMLLAPLSSFSQLLRDQ
jgi:predicted RNase H-like HicB family nuclease